jgi:GT2 family glycosyltransferase
LQQSGKANFQLHRVCVVDNASTDDSLSGIDCFNLPLVLIKNEVNRGFGTAVNQVADDLRGDYLLLLNPDTKVFTDSLEIPLAYLEKTEHAKAGIVGIQNVDENGAVIKTCARFPTPGRLIAKSLGFDRLFPAKPFGLFMVDWDHKSTREVDHVIGSFFLVRREVWQHLKGFDQRFFMYFEDVDFSRRAAAAAWVTMFICDARVYHRGGGTSDQIKAKRLFYSLRSTLVYACKHFSKSAAGLVAGVILLIEPWTRIAWSLARMRPAEMIQTLQGYVMLYRDLPNLWSNLRGK